MKIHVCILGILCLFGLECQIQTPVFANGAEENLNPQIAIEDFVRSLHPHGVSMTSALQYKSQRENVRKLLEMLKNEENKPYWSTIVVTLGVIADPSAIPEIIDFLKKLEKKSFFDEVERRALSSGVWALGIVINQQRGDTESANRELGEASKFLIKKSQGKKETTFDQQHSFPSPDHQAENGNSNGAFVRDPAILGLAFADTEETKEELAKIYRDESDPKFRSWLEQVIQAQQEIHKVGLLCYREPQHPSCQIQQMGHTLAK